MAEREAMEAPAQHFLRCRLAVFAEKEPGRIDDIGVAPTVGDDARDVAARIEAGIAELFVNCARTADSICAYDMAKSCRRAAVHCCGKGTPGSGKGLYMVRTTGFAGSSG